jgi:hypothetical protein
VQWKLYRYSAFPTLKNTMSFLPTSVHFFTLTLLLPLTPMLQFALLWSFLLLIAYLWANRTPATRWARWSLWGIVGVALLVRMVPALLLENGAPFDIQSYEVVADLVRSGADVYTSEATVNRHPYLPLHLYWLAAARGLAEVSGVAYAKVVKWLPIVVDVAITPVVVWFWQVAQSRVSTRQKDAQVARGRAIAVGEAERLGMLYALNPVPVLVCAYHGQFDAEPVLWMVLATVFTALPPGLLAGWQQSMGAGAWLGLGILTKSYPVLALPALLPAIKSWNHRALFVVAMGAVPLLGVLLYTVMFNAPFWEVVQRAIGYNFGIGIYGYTYFARLAREVGGDGRWLQWAVEYGRFITVGLLAVVWWVKVRHQSAPAALLTILVAFFAITHAFAIQYLGWLVPVALLNRETRWLVAYTIAAYFYMVVAYWGLIFATTITVLMPLPQADYLLIMPASLPIWGVSVAWLWARLRSRSEGKVMDAHP